jgi:outer membrane lipoprotein SlyB
MEAFMKAKRTIPAAHVLFAAALAIAGTAGAQQTHGGEPNAAPPVAGAPVAAHAVCRDCGVVQSIRYVEEKGQSSGVGAVAGGVVGGLLGHQIGSGRGNTVATIAGAGAGAYAGNEIEKNRKKRAYWTVSLRMDDGHSRTFTYGSKPAVHEGERVKLVDGGKRLALLTR